MYTMGYVYILGMQVWFRTFFLRFNVSIYCIYM